MASVQEEITYIADQLKSVTKAPDALCTLIEKLRSEMEIPAPVGRSGGQSGARQFQIVGGSSSLNWRGGQMSSGSGGGGSGSKAPFTSSSTSHSPSGGGGRYISRFVTKDSIDGKILNSVIGNKLNSFTPTTYNDTRDFIYQILDSGETEFIREFVEKVFMKATCEDLYCSLFAKLIAEIAHRYPVMYDEMKKYHSQFIQVFDEAGDGDVKKKQHRMGYGEFISELASQNALDKEQLLEIVQKVSEKIWEFTQQADKLKVVEEFVNCLVRLLGCLKERSPRFFSTVSKEIQPLISSSVIPLIDRKAGDRPGLSSISRYALMNVRDLVLG